MKFIFKISWFESKRHTISYTDMYYENTEDTKWVFETTDWYNDLVRVEYIMVSDTHPCYLRAVENSKRANTFIHSRYFINNELGWWDIDSEEKEKKAKSDLIDMIIELEFRNIKYKIPEKELDICEIIRSIKERTKNYSIRDLLDYMNDLEYKYSNLVK